MFSQSSLDWLIEPNEHISKQLLEMADFSLL